VARPEQRAGAAWRALTPYLAAVLAVAVATGITWVVPLLHDRLTYFVFWPVVFFSAWRGGAGPGLLATALATAVVGMLLIADPFGSSLAETIILAAFAVSGVVAAVVVGRRESGERAVRDSERRFRELADTAPMLLWMATTDRRCVYVNRGWLDLTGRAFEQELGDRRIELVHADDRGRYLDTYRAAFAARRPFEVEYRLRRRDGEYRWLLERGRVRTADGEFLGYIATAIDVTERRRATQELATRATQQAAVAEMGQRALVTQQPAELLDTAVTLVARVLDVEMCTVLELLPGGRAFVVRAGAGCRPGVVGHTQVPAGRDSQAGYTLLVDGPVVCDDVHAETRFTPSALFRTLYGEASAVSVVIAGHDGPFGVLTAHAMRRRRFAADDANFLQAIAHTVAAGLAREASFRREQAARAQAEAANNAKDNFLATISHELRTPLSPIVAWTRLLRQGALDDVQRRRAVDVIERNARVQAQLVDDLLDVSRIVSGKLRLDVRPVALVPIVEAALETIRPAAEAKGIRLETAFPRDSRLVAGDGDRLQQVVWNLLSNAVKFTPAGGRVQLAVEHGDAHMTVVVSDTGRGVPPELLPRLFERFWQADAGASRDHGGLGLGLAIVRHIVEQHGGSVHAESAGADRGSRFTVRLPLVGPTRLADGNGPRPPAAERASAQVMPRLDGVRVLLVDDEPDSNDAVAAVLRSCGAEVRVAASAREALDELGRWAPEVLVSDIAMPGEDGYALIARVRALPGDVARVPAVALTAYASLEDRRRLLAAGFQRHAPKPVDPAQLAAVVASVTDDVRRPKRRIAVAPGR
jgi:PAS domain S-box-containing protein